MTKVIDAAAAAGRSGHGVNDEGNKENTSEAADAKPRFKSEEEIVSKDDQIELTKAEMGEVRLENQRLRMHLERLTKDYQTLQTQFQDIIIQQDTTRRSSNNNYNVTSTPMTISSLSSQQDVEEHDISLRLGTTTSTTSKREVMVMNKNHDNDDNDRGLALGLDSCSNPLEVTKTDRKCSTEPLTTNTSTDNSFDQEEKKEDIMGETWPPPKMMKRSAEDEIDSQHNNGKRARVSVRARCDTPTMNDGCQWRKYGQKIAKGNPCPRAYYRCTVAPSCPVRKQVQRCAEDMSILITTYEGTHNHPLTAAATAMASTTSAAASMLLSGSSTSSRSAGLGQPTTSATTTSAGLHGLTYNLANGTTLSQQSRPHQFYIQNNSHISSSPNTHPTITLDLTTSNPFSTTPFTNPHFNRFASSTASNDPSQLFSSKSTSLNFASIDSSNNSHAAAASSLSWATNNHNNALGYRNMYPQSNNRNNHNLGSLTLAASSRYPQENIYQSFMQKPSSALHINNHQQQLQQQQPQLPDHIAAATKAITADPSFQTALAAALTSIIGGTSGGVATNNNNSEKMQVSSSSLMKNLGQKMKWLDQSGTNGCGSSYLSSTLSSVSNAQTSSGLMLLQPPPSAASKSKSTSPCENKQDHNAS